MGCFDLSCCVSGLPLGANDPVMFFLITRNPFIDGGRCTHGIGGRWFARTFPLLAAYSDYGSVIDVEDGPARLLWMRGLEADMHEMGVGDNACHDVPTRRDMSFDKMLEALWEGRVRVDRPRSWRRRREEHAKHLTDLGIRPPEAVPTLRGVEGVLRAAGLPISSEYGEAGYQIDETGHGEVRLRWEDGHSSEELFAERFARSVERLEAAGCLFPQHASVLWPHDHDEAELVMRPKLGTPEYYGPSFADDKAPLQVEQAMVRLDVWNELLRNPGVVGHTLDELRDGIREAWREVVCVPENYDLPAAEFLEFRRLRHSRLLFRHGLPGAWIFSTMDCTIPHGTMGLGQHAEVLADAQLDPESPLRMTPEQTEAFVQRAAEFAYVSTALNHGGYQWRPSHNSPGQCCSPGPALAIIEPVYRVACRLKAAYDDEAVRYALEDGEPAPDAAPPEPADRKLLRFAEERLDKVLAAPGAWSAEAVEIQVLQLLEVRAIALGIDPGLVDYKVFLRKEFPDGVAPTLTGILDGDAEKVAAYLRKFVAEVRYGAPDAWASCPGGG